MEMSQAIETDLDLQMMAVTNDLLEAVARHPGLEELKIGGDTHLVSSRFFIHAQPHPTD